MKSGFYFFKIGSKRMSFTGKSWRSQRLGKKTVCTSTGYSTSIYKEPNNQVSDQEKQFLPLILIFNINFPDLL